MRFWILASLALLCTASSALAQTEGLFSVGGSVTVNATSDDDVDSAITVGPLVRLNPRKGWGPAGAFNWYRADLLSPAGGAADFARLRIRPLMAGVSYTIGSQPVLTSFSVVAGPSFNSTKFKDDYVPLPGESIDAGTSFAVRPGVGVTWTLAARVAAIGFAGYMINRPDVVYRNAFGDETRDRWKADSVVLSVALVYSLF